MGGELLGEPGDEAVEGPTPLVDVAALLVGADEFEEVADVIAEALKPGADVSALRSRVDALTEQFPLYPGLEEW